MAGLFILKRNHMPRTLKGEPAAREQKRFDARYREMLEDCSNRLMRFHEQGPIIGWKKCYGPDGGSLVKLSIPTESRLAFFRSRLRTTEPWEWAAEFADVLEVIAGPAISIAGKSQGHQTRYVAGERVTCHRWNPELPTGGIFFFPSCSDALRFAPTLRVPVKNQ